MHGRGRPVTKINYNGYEIEKANRTLTQIMEKGALHWLKTKFEHCPMEALPNVWEGDEGMMKHVPKFPMPPLIALAEPPSTAEASTESPQKAPAEGGPEDAEMSDDGDFDFVVPQALPERKVEEPKYKKREKEKYFWINMAKVFMKLAEISQSIFRLRFKFFSEHEMVRKHACQQLVKIYQQLKRIKGKLIAAEEELNTNGYVNLFKVMPLHSKKKFKRYYNIEGHLPVNLQCIVRRHGAVRGKVRDILHRYAKNVLPFKDILSSIIVDLLNKSNEKDALLLTTFGELGESANGGAENAVDVAKRHPVSVEKAEGDTLPSDDDDDDELVDAEGNPKKKRPVGAGGDAVKLENDTETPSTLLSKEDKFWKSITELHRRIGTALINLSKLDKIVILDSSRSKKPFMMSFSKKLFTIYMKICTFHRSLVKLKEELKSENFEEKKVFTMEELASDGLDNVTPDNSMLAIEAYLDKLKNEYLRVQNEKHDILEECGYHTETEMDIFSIDKNIQLVRVCGHSKTIINVNTLLYEPEDKNQTSTDENLDGEGTDQASSLDAGADAQPNDEGDDAADDDSEAEDSFDASKTVNSLSFFMKNFGPEAFAPTEMAPCEQATEDFIEKERQHWNKLQKMVRKINRAVKSISNRNRNSHKGRKQKLAVHSMCSRMKDFYQAYELERTESYRVGYCKQVTYQNLGFHTQNSANLFVTSLDQIKDRLDNLHGLYKDAARRMGLIHLFKL